MGEQLPDSISNNYAIQEQPSGLLTAESIANHSYKEHPHPIGGEPEAPPEVHEKTRGIVYNETELADKPFIIAERPDSKKRPDAEPPTPVLPRTPVEPATPVRPNVVVQPESDRNREQGGSTPWEVRKNLSELSETLSDSRHVPTPEEYDRIHSLAERISVRYKDPEQDGQAGMGYFIEGSDERLNAHQARKLLDKARITEWVFGDDDEEDIADRITQDNDPRRIEQLTDAASRSQHLITLMSYGEFLGPDKDPDDQKNLDSYQAYTQKRITLDSYILDNYREEYDNLEQYPRAYLDEAIEDFRDGIEADRGRYRRMVAERVGNFTDTLVYMGNIVMANTAYYAGEAVARARETAQDVAFGVAGGVKYAAGRTAEQVGRVTRATDYMGNVALANTTHYAGITIDNARAVTERADDVANGVLVGTALAADLGVRVGKEVTRSTGKKVTSRLKDRLNRPRQNQSRQSNNTDELNEQDVERTLYGRNEEPGEEDESDSGN